MPVKITPNTNVYTASMTSGVTKDHRSPREDPRVRVEASQQGEDP